MRLSLSASLVLALTASSFTSASSGVITMPMKVRRTPENLNPESLTHRYLQKRASATLPLVNINNDVIYTVSASLGTPPQAFDLAIDTGSPATWVSATSCNTGGCAKTDRFSCASSASCSQLPDKFDASYVSGQSVSGTYMVENYTIGALKFRGVAGLVSTNTAVLPDGIDGIMGLWYYAAGSVVPILNILKNSTLLDAPVIGVWLRPSNAKTDSESGGEISFGGLNAARYTGEITYIDCIAGRPWTLPVGSITIGDKKIDGRGANAAIDTGTTAMLMPKANADEINAAIPGAVQLPQEKNLWILPCSGSTPITMTFGAFTATIPYTDVAMQTSRIKTKQGDYCLSALMFPTGSTLSIQEWLVGDVFLKNVYSVYDFGRNAQNGGRIGFAQLADNERKSGAASTSASVKLMLSVVAMSATALLWAV